MAVDSAQAPNHQPKAKIFISYSRKNMAFADRLETALKERGFEPLIDRTEIYAFEDWWKRIQALIAQADTVIFVLSPTRSPPKSAPRRWPTRPRSTSASRPFVLQRVDDRLVPEALARLNFIFFDDEAHFADAPTGFAMRWRPISAGSQHTELARPPATGRRRASRGAVAALAAVDEAERWIASRPRTRRSRPRKRKHCRRKPPAGQPGGETSSPAAWPPA